MRVFLTGGSGYIGRATIGALLRHGHTVEALARNDRAAETVSALGATPVPGGLRDPGVLNAAAARAEAVVHLAQAATGDEDLAAATAMQDGIGTGPDRQGLQVHPLFQEPRVVMVPVGHRLADRRSVTVKDLAAEHLLQDPNAVPEWRDVALELQSGERPEVPVIHQVEEKLELVAAGAGICVLPLSTANFYTRPDVIPLPVDDLGPNEVALAWVAARRSPLIRDFAETAADTLAQAHYGDRKPSADQVMHQSELM
ncbi:LysR substrate-binding domain-containing protein [Streptomyces chartreusis]